MNGFAENCSESQRLASWSGVYGLVGEGGMALRRLAKAREASRRSWEGKEVKNESRTLAGGEEDEHEGKHTCEGEDTGDDNGKGGTCEGEYTG